MTKEDQEKLEREVFGDEKEEEKMPEDVKRSRITKEQIKTIIDLHKQGKSVKEICTELKLKGNKIRRVLRKNKE